MHVLILGLGFFLLPPAICDEALDSFNHRHLANASQIHATCTMAVKIAIVQNVDPFIVASTCEEETKCLPNLVSSAGAQGPLQVTGYWVDRPLSEMSQYALTFAGVRALKLLRECKRINWQNHTCDKPRSKPRSWAKALCHYNGGNACGPLSQAYSKRILRDTRRLKKAFKRKYERHRF